MDSYKCEVCGFTYNEDQGLEQDGIHPKTKWEDVDNDWFCPDCGVKKIRFIKVEKKK